MVARLRFSNIYYGVLLGLETSITGRYLCLHRRTYITPYRTKAGLNGRYTLAATRLLYKTAKLAKIQTIINFYDKNNRKKKSGKNRWDLQRTLLFFIIMYRFTV